MALIFAKDCMNVWQDATFYASLACFSGHRLGDGLLSGVVSFA